jgi:hypothetical protein
MVGKQLTSRRVLVISTKCNLKTAFIEDKFSELLLSDQTYLAPFDVRCVSSAYQMTLK